MEMNRHSILYLLFFQGVITLGGTVSYRETVLLYKNITFGKNIAIRPVLNQSQSVVVHVGFFIGFIPDFDEVGGVLSLLGFFWIRWRDETVSWNPTTSGIGSLLFGGNEFWRPSFEIVNAIRPFHIYKDDTIKRVYYDGTIEWGVANRFDVSCVADTSKYPFDVHECNIAVAPWGYNRNEISFHNTSKIYTKYLTQHSTWHLTKTGVGKIVFPEFVALTLKFEIKRRSTFFVLHFLLPIYLMSILNVFVFFLPPESGERVGYAMTMLLALVVFLTMSSESLPATSSPRISGISILLITDVTISTLIVMLVIIGLRVYHQNDQITISPITVGFVHCVRYVRYSRCKRRKRKVENQRQDKTNTESGTDNSVTLTWNDVGREVDFVFFTIMSIVTLFMHILYIVDVTIGL